MSAFGNGRAPLISCGAVVGVAPGAKAELVSSTHSCAGAVTGASAPAATWCVQALHMCACVSFSVGTLGELEEGKPREDDYVMSLLEGNEMHAGPGQGGISDVLPPTKAGFCAGGFSPLLV